MRNGKESRLERDHGGQTAEDLDGESVKRSGKKCVYREMPMEKDDQEGMGDMADL
jgi:hypothetical protein